MAAADDKKGGSADKIKKQRDDLLLALEREHEHRIRLMGFDWKNHQKDSASCIVCQAIANVKEKTK